MISSLPFQLVECLCASIFFFNKIAAAFKQNSIILLCYWLIKGGSMLGLENRTRFVLWDDVSVEDVDVALEVML